MVHNLNRMQLQMNVSFNVNEGVRNIRNTLFKRNIEKLTLTD